MLAQPCPDKILQLLDKCRISPSAADDKGLDHLSPERIGDTDCRRFLDIRMAQQNFITMAPKFLKLMWLAFEFMTAMVVMIPT